MIFLNPKESVGATAIILGYVKFWVGSLRSLWKRVLKRHTVGLKVNFGKPAGFLNGPVKIVKQDRFRTF
jgi:hypothetical protein